MRARPVVTLALLLTTLASLALVQRPSSPAAAAVPAQKPFKHGDHVQSEWLDPEVPEVWRDCRGCHRFDAQNPVSAPQQQCPQCHGQGLAPAAGWPQDLKKFRSRTGDAFRHHTHAMLECRQCHGAVGQNFLPDDFDVRTGPGQCASCHEQGRLDFASLLFFDAAAKEAAGRLGATEYQEKLVEAFAGPTGGLNTQPLPVGGAFDHADHCGVVDGALGALFACADCHANIPQATARETGTGKIPTGRCGNCHKTDRAPARAATGVKPLLRRQRSLGTFAHADHYAFLTRGKRNEPKVCLDEAYTWIEKGCDACHKGEPKAFGRPDADFPFGGGNSKDRYIDCQQCHNVAGWQTGETTSKPLHASTGGSGGWAPCAKCHVFGQPDMRKVRVMAEVARLTESTFVFPANVHPDITKIGITRSEQAGRAVVQECKECHRARVPALDTRLQKKVFRHDTHLPAAPQPEDCSSCHPSASTAVRSAELAGSDRRTYTLSVCTKCHWGDAVVEERAAGEAEQLAAAKRACVEFPHGPHVGKANLSCLQCHAAAADGRDIETLPGAQLCNKCHDHKEGQQGEPKYEGLFDGGALSCARCHHERTAAEAAPAAVVPLPGAGATDSRYVVEQTAFGGFADPQFHPLGVACTECHKADEKDGRLVDVPGARNEDPLSATLNVSVHAGGGRKEPADCLRCHWKPVGKWRDAVNTSAGTEEDKAFRFRPGSKETRDKFGNDIEGYPGNRARG